MLWGINYVPQNELPTCNANADGIMASSLVNVNTWGTTVTASGTNHQLIRCNGTNWVVIG
jgi:hypothetical protein